MARNGTPDRGPEQIPPVPAPDPEDRQDQDQGHASFSEDGESQAGGGVRQKAASPFCVHGRADRTASEKVAASGISTTPAWLRPIHPAEVPRIAVANHAGRSPNWRRSRQKNSARNTTETIATGSAGRRIVTQPEPEADARHPIKQRRFFEPRLAPKPRRNPIAGARHFAADRGIARLVRS